MSNWNRQGGSNRDNINKPSSKSQKKKTQAGSAIDKLKQSNSISFKLVLKKDKTADYGEFGDEVNWIMDDLTDLEIDEDLSLPTNYSLTNPTRPITIETRVESDEYRINSSTNITPYNISDQYEIVVKYAANNLVLTIMSGQAYMARLDINNARLDYALVVTSTVDLTFGNGNPSKVNAIVLGGNSSYKIIDSLYQWVRGKLAITSDVTGKSSDSQLSAIAAKTAPELPTTKFTYQSVEHVLFGTGDGLKPSQICLSAIDKLLTFRSLTSYPSTTYDVLWIGARLALCAALGGDNPPDPTPIGDYRFIVVFIDGSQFNIGGYDSINSIDPILAAASVQNNRFGFNIIDPNAIDWKGIKPRSSPNPPAYTGMYWRGSYVKKIAVSGGLFEYKLAVFGDDVAEQLSPNIPKFGQSDPFDPSLDLIDLRWFGANKWQSRIVASDKDESISVSSTNPIDSVFMESIEVFPTFNNGTQNDDGRNSFVLSMRPTSDPSTGDPQFSYLLYRLKFDGISTTKEEFTHQIIQPPSGENYYEKVGRLSESSYEIVVKQVKDSTFSSGGNTTTIASYQYNSASYYNRVPVVLGQSDLTASEKSILIEHAKIDAVTSKVFRPDTFDFIITDQQISTERSLSLDRRLEVSGVRLNSSPAPISFVVDNLSISTSQIDLLQSSFTFKYKYFSGVKQDITNIQDGSDDISLQVDRYYNRISTYYTAKTDLCGYLESAYFVMITSSEIINCKVAVLSLAATNNNVSIADPTRYTRMLGIGSINTENDGAVDYCVTNPNGCFYYQTTNSWDGFEASDILANPQDAVRQVFNINYSVQSRYAHQIPNIVDAGKTRLLFVDPTYFNPTNTIVAKPASSDPGLIARIYKSYRSASAKAIAEKWVVHSSGWIELTAITETNLGQYSPSTRNIYFYPGDA